jgi:hypothetical protein
MMLASPDPYLAFDETALICIRHAGFSLNSARAY